MSFCISEEGPGRASRTASPARRFARRSIKPVIVRLSRRLSVTYWPGRNTSLSAILFSLLAGFVPQLAGAAPTGSKVVAGVASVTQPTVGSTQIQQTSQNAIINWQSFSIGAGESVRFVQPNANAIALNRVIGADPSRIFGTLSANGQVFLVNQAGVYFAPGASVDVGGLLATSMNISDANFLSRKFVFSASGNAGAVSNYGQLRGAYVTLAAPQVTNGGGINTAGGTTALAAGSRMALDLSGDRLVSMSVDAAAANAAVVNSGSISADGGKVFMTARSANAVLDTVINTTGIVRASSIVSRGGQIVIDGGSAGTVAVDGMLAASGGSKGGTVEVLGDRIALQTGARIDVSGDAGGGRALVGGDFHGAGDVRTASFTQVDKGAVINADARTSGKGGDVAVWADQHTDFAGSISATGGAHGGDGGFVETSGKHTLAFSGAVNTTAAKGATGTLLLDPTDITISTAPSSSIGMAGGTFSGTASSSTLNVVNLTAALGSSNVVVDTSSGFAAMGNIAVNTSVVWGSANSLTLKADNNITVNALIQNTSSGAINLNGSGAVTSGSLRTNSGDINIAGNPGGSSRAGSVTGTSIMSNSGSVNVRSQGDVTTGTINIGAGTISIDGNTGVAITGALATVNSGSAAIVVNAGASSMAGSPSGGDISVSGGSVSVGAGGRATLYTGSVAGSTGLSGLVGAGSGHFRYNSAAGTDNFSAPLGTGAYVVYRESPTLTVTGSSPSIIYGAAAPGLSFTYSGLANGDSSGQALSTGATVSASTTNSSSNHIKAGTYAVTPAGAVDQLGYSVAYVPGSFVVAQKALTSSGSTAAGKAYDGSTAAAVNTGATTVASGGASTGDGKAYSGDLVSVNHAALASGAFVDANAGANKTVTISAIALQGADAANYSASGTTLATITPKALTASISAPNKVYDGTTTAAPVLTLAGLVGNEALGVSGAGTFNSKDVMSADTVTVNSIALANGANGGMAANYSLAPGQTVAANITPKSVSASGLSVAASKVYDATTKATVTGSATLSTEPAGSGSAFDGKVYAGDGISIAGMATGTYNSKNVASASTVIIGGLSLSGADLANYTLAVAPFNAVITPKLLSMSGLSVPATKPDSTSTDAIVSGTAVLAAPEAVGTGTVTDGKSYIGDTVAIAGTAGGTYNSADPNLATTVTFTGLSLSGDSASNYSLNTVLRLPPKLRFPR